jgi:hypothetical protein
MTPTSRSLPSRGVTTEPASPTRVSSRTPASGALLPAPAMMVLLAAAFVAVPFVTGGGVDNSVATGGNTWTDIALTLVGGAVIVTGTIAGGPARRQGLATLLAMAALTALTGLSLIWSVTPDISWLAFNQLLAYLAVFGAAVMTARNAPTGWRVLIGAVALAVTALCAWSLLAKVFPATLAAENIYGRLQAPFGYWNALGISAAAGLPCLLWAGARRDGGSLPRAAAVVGIALVTAVLVASYSRSADLAAVVAVGLWALFVPLRLRTAVIGASGAIGGAVISVWYLTHHALSHDHIAPAAQDHAGHTFGIVLLVVIVVMAAGGLVIARAMERMTVSPATRRRWGIGLSGLVALIPVVVIVGLALSSRGLFGEISHGWSELTSSTAVSADNAGRVLQFGSSRPVYWHEALAVGDHALLKGVGALGFAIARLRWTTDALVVQQAHGFVFQTFADLGVLGLLVTAALLGTWLFESARTLVPRRRWSTLRPSEASEREGMVVLAVVAVSFGVQSTLDWTWYFAGVAVPVLACAGWLAGRGAVAADAEQALAAAPARRSILDRPLASITALAVVGVALIGAWFQWQPWRAQQAIQRVEFGVDGGARAFADARTARSANPLSLDPLDLLATLYEADHQTAAALRETTTETTLQPENPNSWEALGEFQMNHGQPQQAIASYQRALVFDIVGVQHGFLLGLIAIAQQKAAAAAG